MSFNTAEIKHKARHGKLQIVPTSQTISLRSMANYGHDGLSTWNRKSLKHSLTMEKPWDSDKDVKRLEMHVRAESDGVARQVKCICRQRSRNCKGYSRLLQPFPNPLNLKKPTTPNQANAPQKRFKTQIFFSHFTWTKRRTPRNRSDTGSASFEDACSWRNLVTFVVFFSRRRGGPWL